MHRLGSGAEYTREMFLDDILRNRTDLLILMARDYLDGAELGPIQRQAMGKNAVHVEIECSSLMATLESDPIENHPYINMDFCLCLRNLAGMIKTIAQGDEANDYGKEAIHHCIETISEIIDENEHINDIYIEDCLNLLLMKLIAVI